MATKHVMAPKYVKAGTTMSESTQVLIHDFFCCSRGKGCLLRNVKGTFIGMSNVFYASSY